ncbi:MAG: hypothetical protein AB1689_06230 [Thermodesulfobacteriota bacterium]
MSSYQPESGTLLIAALLVLALAFAGAWIVAYVQPGGNPWHIVPWFLLAAGVVIVVGLLAVIYGGHHRRS